jgi:predicted P-loop ATPase
MTMKPIETILGKLEKVSPHNNGHFTALCPAHDDHKPSLSITEGDDGRTLLYCHAGCEFADIMAAMGLDTKDAFPERKPEPQKSHIMATYDYHDADGTLLYQAVRLHPKNFYQRRPNGKDGWINNLGNVERILYRLPQLLKAPSDEWVFVCEGEKSAEAIAGLGLVATTNSGGAGKWYAHYSRFLQGRRVCILPDADPQGENHAAQVASSLKDVAQQVRIVHLPAVTLKSDPHDWVSAGGTREALFALLDAAQDIKDIPLFWDKEEAPTTADYVAALESLGYHFRLNVCNDVVEVNGEPMSDVLRARIRSQMRDLNYRRVNVMEDAWIYYASEQHYHPVGAFLDSLVWDGQEHIGKLAGHFVDEFGFFSLFLTRWLIGAVARVYERRGCQNRMLVLDGEQGLGKSFFVRWLAEPIGRSELFIEGPINPEEKDDKIRLITAWIWEVSELGSTTRRSDREALKYFLSQQQVTIRKPYGHYDLVKPALASFVGTVNNISGFLDDPTGYRRFMTSHLTAIDWSYANEVDPEQVWAQAKALYDRGDSWELSAEEAEDAKFANEQYEIEDPLIDIFLACYEITDDPGDFVATKDIRAVLNDHNWRLTSPRSESMAIADAMRRRGIRKSASKEPRGYISIKRKQLRNEEPLDF